MATITNTPKKTLGDYTIQQLGSFSLEQLADVSIDRQFTPIANTPKVSFEETWDSNTTTWDIETRTWNEMGSLINNTPTRLLGSYTMEQLADYTPEQLANISFNRQFSPMRNTPKT